MSNLRKYFDVEYVSGRRSIIQLKEPFLVSRIQELLKADDHEFSTAENAFKGVKYSKRKTKHVAGVYVMNVDTNALQTVQKVEEKHFTLATSEYKDDVPLPAGTRIFVEEMDEL